MLETRMGVSWTIAALALWLVLTISCTSSPSLTNEDLEGRTGESGTASFRSNAENSVSPSATIANATLAPPPTPPTPPTRVHTEAKRSDFLVPITSRTTPTPTAAAATRALTSSVSATSILTTTQARVVDLSADCHYDAEFISDVTIPDDMELEPDATFLKTWRVRNSGTCDWGAGIELAFVKGDQLSGPTAVVVSPTLAAEMVDVSATLVTPQEHGIYESHWRLRTPDGRPFGEPVFVRVAAGPSAAPLATSQPKTRAGENGVPALVLLNYFAWYDGNGWDDCNISAADKPLQPYHSDDPVAVARHVRLALDAGADGFTQQWFAPGGRTDRNFAMLLSQSEGSAFRSTVVFLRHIWHGSPAPSQTNIAEAVRYILEQYGHHPNFLKLGGKPVLFFTDVYRVPRTADQTPQQAWASIRAQADPNNDAWWITEGLDPSYLAVFDGLWVYKITHASYPLAYLKASQWAEGVRQWEAQTGKRKLWIATVSPGWDDTRAGCRTDVRVPSAAHRQDRAGGAFFRATFDAALASQPDWLWVNSFNEWVEGTYVEPSEKYGDVFLQITSEFANRFKAQ